MFSFLSITQSSQSSSNAEYVPGTRQCPPDRSLLNGVNQKLKGKQYFWGRTGWAGHPRRWLRRTWRVQGSRWLFVSFEEKLRGKGEQVLGGSGGWLSGCWGVTDEDKLQFVLVSWVRPCANLFFKSKENRKKFKESKGHQARPGTARVHADPDRRSRHLSDSALSQITLRIRF